MNNRFNYLSNQLGPKRMCPYSINPYPMNKYGIIDFFNPTVSYNSHKNRQGKEEMLSVLAESLYIYGYPLVIMILTKQKMLSQGVEQNTLYNQLNYADTRLNEFLIPHADTLYTTTWLSLRDNAFVIDLPYTDNTYNIFTMFDAWTNVFFAPGTRINNGLGKRYVLVGPSYKRPIPDDVDVVESPTNDVWIVARTEVTRPHDLEVTNEIQKKYSIVSLNPDANDFKFENALNTYIERNNIDMGKKIAEIVDSLTPEQYYTILNLAMYYNIESLKDIQINRALSIMGMYPSLDFDYNKLSNEVKLALESTYTGSKASIDKEAMSIYENSRINNWVVMNKNLGVYGSNYLRRAAITKYLLASNMEQDIVFSYTSTDSENVQLDGTSEYIVHFHHDQLPPVNSFWSLLMYDKNNNLVSNSLNRYFLGSNSRTLNYEEDGSLNIYLQSQKPGEKFMTNYLPAPQGKFNLVIGMYYPKDQALNGLWKPPTINKDQ